MQYDWHVTDFEDMKSLVGEKSKSLLRISDTFNILLKTRKPYLNVLALLLFLNPAKEVRIGFGKPVGTILESLSIDRCELWVGCLDFLDDIIEASSLMKGAVLCFVSNLTSLK